MFRIRDWERYKYLIDYEQSRVNPCASFDLTNSSCQVLDLWILHVSTKMFWSGTFQTTLSWTLRKELRTICTQRCKSTNNIFLILFSQPHLFKQVPFLSTMHDVGNIRTLFSAEVRCVKSLSIMVTVSRLNTLSFLLACVSFLEWRWLYGPCRTCRAIWETRMVLKLN